MKIQQKTKVFNEPGYSYLRLFKRKPGPGVGVYFWAAYQTTLIAGCKIKRSDGLTAAPGESQEKGKEAQEGLDIDRRTSIGL